MVTIKRRPSSLFHMCGDTLMLKGDTNESLCVGGQKDAAVPSASLRCSLIRSPSSAAPFDPGKSSQLTFVYLASEGKAPPPPAPAPLPPSHSPLTLSFLPERYFQMSEPRPQLPLWRINHLAAAPSTLTYTLRSHTHTHSNSWITWFDSHE